MNKNSEHSFEYFFKKGILTFEKNDYKKAIKRFNKAIETEPDNFETWYSLGYSYYKVSDYEKFIMCFKKVIALKPDFNSAYFYLGLSYHLCGQFDTAIDYYNKSIELKYDEKEAVMGLMLSYGRKNDVPKILELAANITEQNPEDISTYFGCANIFIELTLYDMAIEYLNKIIKMDPTNDYYFSLLAKAYTRLGNHNKAKEILSSLKKA